MSAAEIAAIKGGDAVAKLIAELLPAGRRALQRTDFMQRIALELDRAYAKHGHEQWGRHEFYGIVKEEFDELWADIKSDAPQAQLEKELVQVAAMCFRYFETRDRYREPQSN